MFVGVLEWVKKCMLSLNSTYILNHLSLQCFDRFGRKPGCFDDFNIIHSQILEVLRNFTLLLCGANSFHCGLFQIQWSRFLASARSAFVRMSCISSFIHRN